MARAGKAARPAATGGLKRTERTERTARPRDAAHTRERILAAARREFARAGFGGATVRAIASDADVSPNLITRYFGGKDGLFEAAAGVRLAVTEMFAGPLDQLGERMAEAILSRWTSITGHDPLLVLLRASGEHTGAAAMLADFLDRESLEPLRHELRSRGLPPREADARARAVDIFMLGVTARLRMLRDDLGDLERTKIWLATAIQSLIDGPHER